jgi:hypothetical protein
MNGGPGNDAKMPIKSPFWIGTESTSGILFFGNSGLTLKVYATGL